MAIAVVDIAALGMGDDAAAAQAFDFGPVGLRGQMVRDVEAAQFGDVVIAGHNLVPDPEVRSHRAKSRCLGLALRRWASRSRACRRARHEREEGASSLRSETGRASGGERGCQYG